MIAPTCRGRSRALALAVLVSSSALGALPGAALGAEIPTQLTGRVIQINEIGDSGITSELAQRGLTVDARVSIAFAIDDTVQPFSVDGPAAVYFDAVVSVRIGAGLYEARYDRSPGHVRRSSVSVADGRDIGLGPTDSYSVQGGGGDTGAILAPGTPESPVVITVSFSDASASAISSEAVAQDVSGFPPAIAAITVVGPNGSIVVALEADPGNGDIGRCAHGQLSAAAKLCRTVLKCRAKKAGQTANKDIGGVKEAACIATALVKYEKRFSKSVATALRKGESCRLEGGDAAGVADQLESALDNFAATILDDLFPQDQADRRLRSKLLKASATQATKDLVALAKDAKKSNAAKLLDRLDANRAKAIKAMDKAIAKADRAGIDAGGLTSASIADDVRELVLAHARSVRGD